MKNKKGGKKTTTDDLLQQIEAFCYNPEKTKFVFMPEIGAHSNKPNPREVSYYKVSVAARKKNV